MRRCGSSGFIRERGKRASPDTRMAIDYDAVLKNARVRSALPVDVLLEAESDEDFLQNLISDEADTVLTLEWDSDRPGGGGA